MTTSAPRWINLLPLSMVKAVLASRHWLMAAWLGAFWAFHLPWVAHPAAAFNLNAFDLAEQIRVHPAILSENPPLRTSALLWIGIPLIASGLALASLRYKTWWVRWGLWGMAFLIALRLIPPQHLLRAPRQMWADDYGKTLFMLTILGLGLVLGVIVLQKWLLARLWLAESFIGILGIILPLIGFNRAYQLLQELQVEVSLGGGLLLYMVVLVVATSTHWLKSPSGG